MSSKNAEVIFYSPHLTPRLLYITGLAGAEILGEPFVVTDDVQRYLNSNAARINYSASRQTEDEIWIQPHALLFENTIAPIELNVFEWEGKKAFFRAEGDYPFDIFAAAFYLVSRYEEYLPYQPDLYGRFPVESAVAFQHGFLNHPIVNSWLAGFAHFLKMRYPHLVMAQRAFDFIPTYDIDEAYSFKHKGWMRTLGAAAKSIVKGHFSEVLHRIKVLSNRERDPFDAYDWMNELHRMHRWQPRYFFLVPSRLSRYDRNILPQKRSMQKIMEEHSGRYEIGLHPSWQSGDTPFLFAQEKKTLEQIIRKPVRSSRQHFIRFTLPGTYRLLLQNGIREDFSMGYGTRNGFRASITTPFYWYDLEREETTELKLYPFCYMDANSFFEERQTPIQALDEMLHYYKTVKAVDGCLLTIWHNTFLGTGHLFEGWREVYREFLDYVSAAE